MSAITATAGFAVVRHPFAPTRRQTVEHTEARFAYVAPKNYIPSGTADLWRSSRSRLSR